MKTHLLLGAFLLGAAAWRASAQEAGGKPTAGFHGDLVSFDMVDADTGWAISSLDNRAALLQTHDGGKSWTEITPKTPQPKVEVPSDVEDTLFYHLLSATHGWAGVQNGAAGPGFAVSLFSTDNGGHDWKRSSFRTTVGAVASLQFPDPRHGFIAVEDEPASGKTHKATYHTVNGGKTWVEGGGLTTEGFFRGMVFRNAADGWVNGEPRGDDEAFFYRTRDGGNHWSAQVFHPPAGFGKYTVQASTPQFFGDRKTEGVVGMQFVQYDPEPRRSVYEIYRTHDGGEHWSRVSVVPEDSEPDLAPSFVDQDHGWILSGDDLLATSDGGANWHPVETNLHFGDNEKPSQFRFVSASAGWVVKDIFYGKDGDRYELLRTTDGGRTWIHRYGPQGHLTKS